MALQEREPIIWHGLSHEEAAAYAFAGEQLGIPVVVRGNTIEPYNQVAMLLPERFTLRVFVSSPEALFQLDSRAAEIVRNNNPETSRRA